MTDATAFAHHFTPAAPERPDDWLPVWRIFVDKAAQNPLNGWPTLAFETHHKTRRVFTLNYHFISDPVAIQHVLMDKLGTYQKPALVNKMLSVALGEGLLTTNGEAWREQRRMMAPVFTPGMVTEFTPTFARVAEQTADRWATGDSDVIDVAAEPTHHLRYHQRHPVLLGRRFHGGGGVGPHGRGDEGHEPVPPGPDLRHALAGPEPGPVARRRGPPLHHRQAG
uniref:Cytochrome P450 n=1 Tax=Phenylobacterium glaciei TaxID=2803784 RepID=A0A974S7Y9_9CAUL|nr:cytochrome P450 [Phenylobacterium glaciei]